MKKHHILLSLLLVGIAAYLLKENRKLKASESIASGELQLLRDAVKKSPGTKAASTLAGKSGRSPGIDTMKFIAGLTAALKDGPGAETENRMKAFEKEYGASLTSATLSEYKEIVALLEKNFQFDQASPKAPRFIWISALGSVAKSDPAWAIERLNKVASENNFPINVVISIFGSWGKMNEGTMGRAYAAALQKWLEAAQAEGRIEEGNSDVANLRAQIAVGQGDQPAAIQQIAQLPHTSQKKAAIEYVQQLQTTDERRQAVEQLSTTLDSQNFSASVRVLASQQGFDAAREVLSSASLTPEKHDVAAASIAAVNIGPETKDRAAWLLETLRSDDRRALEEFTSTWTEGNHPEAANWIKSMTPGPKRDAALKGFIPVAARIDGATAMDWALTVSDPLLRNQLYCGARGKWQETNADQANEYSKAHPLDMEAISAASK